MTTSSTDQAALLHRLNDATKPVDAADRNLIIRALTASSDQAAGEPIPMLLFCPKCHSQHIDSPKWERDPHDVEQGLICTWSNPPHKSHLCHACGNIWRPADVETTGVVCIQTKGKADTWDPAAPTTVRSDQSAGEPFQQRVQPWMLECFGSIIANDSVERNHRFIEEALELVQACGMARSEAHQLVDYVYNRPVGEIKQEVGA